MHNVTAEFLGFLFAKLSFNLYRYLVSVYRYSLAKSEWAIPEKNQTGWVEDIEFPSKKNIQGLKIKTTWNFQG